MVKNFFIKNNYFFKGLRSSSRVGYNPSPSSALLTANLSLLAKALENGNISNLRNELLKFPNINEIKLQPYLSSEYLSKYSHPADYITNCDNLLLWAVKTRRKDLVTTVLYAGISPDIEGYSALQYAAKIGDVEILDYLMKFSLSFYTCWKIFYKKKINNYGRVIRAWQLYQHQNKDINQTNCLTNAIEGDHLEVVKYIHKNYGFENHAHIFYTAAVSGSKSVLEYLLNSKIKPDSVFGELALVELAADNGALLRVLEYLEYKIIPVDLLKSIIDNGNLGVLTSLVQHNYQVDVENSLFIGGSTITHAASKKQLGIVRYLLEIDVGLSLLESKVYERLHLLPEVKDYILDFKRKKEFREHLEKNLENKTIKSKKTKI